MANEQNDIDIELTEAELAELDGAIEVLERLGARFPVVSAEDKANHLKAPDGSGDWMEGMLTRADQNLDILPRSYSPASIRRDLALDKVLAPRQLRLERVVERIVGARFLARSDAFSALLGVRRKLKEGGVTGVDDTLNDGLRRFFTRESKTDPVAPAAPNTP